MISPAPDFAKNMHPDTNAFTDRLATTVFGIPTSQTWVDLMLWERFLNARQPAHIIELGTGRAGLTLFLALQCRSRGLRMVTVDTYNWTGIAGELYPLVNVKRIQADVFACTPALIEEARRMGGSIAVFCDNGDKPREFRMVAPLLRAGDFIATHDWGNEIEELDVAGLPVRMIEPGLCERLHSITRWFEVIA